MVGKGTDGPAGIFWDLPPLQPAAHASDAVISEEDPAEAAGVGGAPCELKRPTARRIPKQDPPPDGTAWNEAVHTWLRAELHTHTYIVTELAGYLARPDRPPQTEASCLRAFFRRAEERPAVALKLAIDFLLMGAGAPA